MRTAAVALLALGLATACASTRREQVALQSGECSFVVYNRTQHALEVRIGRELSTAAIGSINQGESLSHAVPCAQGRVLLFGFPIPEKIGARVLFSYVDVAVDLKPGTRPNVELTWP